MMSHCPKRSEGLPAHAVKAKSFSRSETCGPGPVLRDDPPARPPPLPGGPGCPVLRPSCPGALGRAPPLLGAPCLQVPPGSRPPASAPPQGASLPPRSHRLRGHHQTSGVLVCMPRLFHRGWRFRGSKGFVRRVTPPREGSCAWRSCSKCSGGGKGGGRERQRKAGRKGRSSSRRPGLDWRPSGGRNCSRTATTSGNPGMSRPHLGPPRRLLGQHLGRGTPPGRREGASGVREQCQPPPAAQRQPRGVEGRAAGTRPAPRA